MRIDRWAAWWQQLFFVHVLLPDLTVLDECVKIRCSAFKIFLLIVHWAMFHPGLLFLVQVMLGGMSQSQGWGGALPAGSQVNNVNAPTQCCKQNSQTQQQSHVHFLSAHAHLVCLVLFSPSFCLLFAVFT